MSKFLPMDTGVIGFNANDELFTTMTHPYGASRITVTPLLEAVETLGGTDDIVQASLHGNRDHVIVRPGAWTQEKLSEQLSARGLKVEAVETGQSTR